MARELHGKNRGVLRKQNTKVTEYEYNTECPCPRKEANEITFFSDPVDGAQHPSAAPLCRDEPVAHAVVLSAAWVACLAGSDAFHTR
jgi:hypothetical protein